jgi:hypothetical protein
MAARTKKLLSHPDSELRAALIDELSQICRIVPEVMDDCRGAIARTRCHGRKARRKAPRATGKAAKQERSDQNIPTPVSSATPKLIAPSPTAVADEGRSGGQPRSGSYLGPLGSNLQDTVRNLTQFKGKPNMLHGRPPLTFTSDTTPANPNPVAYETHHLVAARVPSPCSKCSQLSYSNDCFCEWGKPRASRSGLGFPGSSTNIRQPTVQTPWILPDHPLLPICQSPIQQPQPQQEGPMSYSAGWTQPPPAATNIVTRREQRGRVSNVPNSTINVEENSHLFYEPFPGNMEGSQVNSWFNWDEEFLLNPDQSAPPGGIGGRQG